MKSGGLRSIYVSFGKDESVIAHYYAYSLQHLRSLEHTMELYYPGYLQNRMKDIPREQKMDN